MEKLTTLSKLLIAGILVGSSLTAWRTYGVRTPQAQKFAAAPAALAKPEGSAKRAPLPNKPLSGRPLRVALSQWPGHMPLVVAAGGLTTQPGSPAHAAGLDLEIVFIEDAPSKNKALQSG